MATEKELRHFVERGCSDEAIWRFGQRYPEHCHFKPNGKPKGVIARLRLALELARRSKVATTRVAHADRWIFDVELPADKWNPEPYTIRILTTPAVDCVLTVLPPRNFMDDKRTKDRCSKKSHRRIVDDVVLDPEPEESAEPITLPPPVKLGASLGDKLLQALQK